MEPEDDIIIVHQGTPEDLFSVVQGTLQEIVGVPKRKLYIQGTSRGSHRNTQPDHCL